MALTLPEAAKGEKNVFVRGVIETFVENQRIAQVIPYRDITTGLDGITVPATADTAYALLRVRAFPDGSLIFLGPNELNPPPGTVVTLTNQYVGEPRFDPGEDRGIFVWRVSSGGPWEIRCSTPNLGRYSSRNLKLIW